MTIEFRNNLRNGSLAGTTKPLGLWGEDSEYGIMKQVLLGPMATLTGRMRRIWNSAQSAARQIGKARVSIAI